MDRYLFCDYRLAKDSHDILALESVTVFVLQDDSTQQNKLSEYADLQSH